MTPEELDKIVVESTGKLTDFQCRCLVHYMIGYMRHASDLEQLRDAYFNQIKAGIEGKPLPYLSWWPTEGEK